MHSSYLFQNPLKKLDRVTNQSSIVNRAKNTIGIMFVLAMIPMTLQAANYYVDPNGCDFYRGNSRDYPYKTIYSALEKVQPGDTVFFRGGRHSYSTPIKISVNGTPEKRICFMSYPGENAIFDFSECTDEGPGVLVTGSYQDYIKQTFENKSGDKGKGLQLESSNNKFVECIFRNNGNSGLQLDGGASNNQMINCDAYFNGKDNASDGDGFCPKLEVGSGNNFSGCRSWQNGDDGWDGYLKADREITTTLDNCWAFKNGYKQDGSKSGGNGNGFKYGSDKGNHNQTLKNCLAFENLNKGFDQNHDKGTITLYNCTSFNNVRYNYSAYDAPNSGHTFTIKNCISIKTTNNTMMDSVGTKVVQAANSWMNGLKVDASDFESVDFSGADGARKSDGSLPELKFMKLKEGSDMIDAGVDVGLSFKGKGPDLGCYESPYSNNTSISDAVLAAKQTKWRVLVNGTQAFVHFNTSSSQPVCITVYNIAGKQIAQIDNRMVGPNESVPVLNMQTTPAGTYICTIAVNGTISSQKIVY